MAIRKYSVSPTTGTGTATAYSPFFSGYLESIEYVKADTDSYTDGVDFTITSEATTESLWTQSNVNASAAVRPRAATHTTAGVGATYDGTRAVLDRIAMSRDRVKIAIASGGNGKTGLFLITVNEPR